MTWQEDMSRAAVSLALPSWEWQDGDVAEVDVDWDAGGTFGGGEMSITVTVERDGERGWNEFTNSGAAQFWMDLMRQADQR